MIIRYRVTILNFVYLSLILVFAGCAVGPDYKEPKINVPTKWQQTDSNSTILDSQNWWKNFNDPVLEHLIAKADTNGLDIKEAFYRIDQARALYDYTTGQYFPDVDAVGSYTRYKISENTPDAAGQRTAVNNIYSAGFDASWEIDLFGQIKRSVQSSKAKYQASIENYNDVVSSLYADIARNYVELRTIQSRIAVAQMNINSQQETLKLTQDRFNAGLTGELDVKQASINLTNTQAEIPPLKAAQTAAINRIAVLLGGYGKDYEIILNPQGLFPTAAQIKTDNIAADLLRRRPDIRTAERELAAQSEQIGVATADLYPSFSLTGYFKYSAIHFDDLGESSAKTYSYGPVFRWNIFNGNRIKNTIKAEKAKTQQYVIRYERAVLSAVEEVENALSAYAEENTRKTYLQDSAEAAEDSVRLVRDLYENGLTDFQNVLDTERTMFVQGDKLAISTGQEIINLIKVYKALGGGWNYQQNEIEK